MAYPYNPYQQPYNYQQTGLIWVQGEAGAKSYMVAPGSTVALFDSEAQRIYLKSADPSGMPSIKILEYNILDYPAPSSAPSTNDYATKKDISMLHDEIEELKKAIGKEE